MLNLLHHRQPAARFACPRPAAYLRGLLLIALILALVGLSPARAAGPATLLRDINPGAGPGWNTPIYSFVAVGSTIYFAASDPVNGREFWKSDGTPAGTVLVKDINPGPADSAPAGLMNVQGTLFFFAGDTAHAGELWKSDGTAEGTVPVTDLPFMQSPSAPAVVIGGMIYFVIMTYPDTSFILMRSDGTPGGTVMLKDQLPQAILASVGNTLFFANGDELWKTDGTPAGTLLVLDTGENTSPTLPNGSIREMLDVNGTLFFASDIYDFNAAKPFVTKLWKSDGTPAGTVLVKQISPERTDHVLEELTNVNGTLFFVGDDGVHGPELWKSDGTAAGTLMIKDVSQDPTFQFPLRELTNVNGTLFFFNRYYEAGQIHHQLWQSDGTEAGTTLVKDVPKLDVAFIEIAHLVDFNGTLFFTAAYSNNQSALWKSDGTPEGTVPVIEFVVEGEYIPRIATLAVSNGMLLFSTWGPTVAQNISIWKSDGTTAGTTVMATGQIAHPSNIDNMTDVNGTLFFTATDGRNGTELWKSNGTPQGTVLVKDINPGAASSSPSYLAAVGGTLFFTADDGQHGKELWKSDGTPAGTLLVRDSVPGAASLSPTELTNANGTLFFTSDQAGHLFDLWKSDGTPAGTALVKQIAPAMFSHRLDRLTNVNGTLFFLDGERLWKSNGTPEGTIAVKTVYTFVPSTPEFALAIRMLAINGTLYFGASDTISNEPSGPFYTNMELWKSDGTPAGTVMVKDIKPVGGLTPANLTNVGGILFFVREEYPSPGELWKSDGTPEGTVLVKEALQSISSLINVNGTLFFTAFDSTNGRQLWKSDGTTAGTTIVKALEPWFDRTLTQPIVQARPEGGVLFAAPAPNRGVELWQTDGTAESTILLQDFTPGPGSSNPAQMLAVGNTIFLTVDAPSSGRELWAIDRGTLGAMPQARDMLIGTRPGVALSGSLAGIALDGAAVTYTIVANGTNGVATITDPATGAFTYTPAQGASGRDSFTFKITDGNRESNTATVTVVFWTSFSSLPLIHH